MNPFCRLESYMYSTWLTECIPLHGMVPLLSCSRGQVRGVNLTNLTRSGVLLALSDRFGKTRAWPNAMTGGIQPLAEACAVGSAVGGVGRRLHHRGPRSQVPRAGTRGSFSWASRGMHLTKQRDRGSRVKWLSSRMSLCCWRRSAGKPVGIEQLVKFPEPTRINPSFPSYHGKKRAQRGWMFSENRSMTAI